MFLSFRTEGDDEREGGQPQRQPPPGAVEEPSRMDHVRLLPHDQATGVPTGIRAGIGERRTGTGEWSVPGDAPAPAALPPGVIEGRTELRRALEVQDGALAFKGRLRQGCCRA